MKKSQWAMTFMVGSILLSGCAGRGYRTNAHSSRSHLLAPSQSTVGPQEEYDIGQPQLAEPMPMDSGYENAVPTVPAPPAQGVSHVKRVGLSRVLFGPEKACGETNGCTTQGCITTTAEGCGTQRSSFRQWCSRMSITRTHQPLCGSQSCTETPCVTEGCTTKPNCIQNACTKVKCKTTRAWNGFWGACKSPFTRSRTGDYCVPATDNSCGDQQPCAEPLIQKGGHQEPCDVHLTEDPFESKIPPQRSEATEEVQQPEQNSAPNPPPIPATPNTGGIAPAMPARPYEDPTPGPANPATQTPPPPANQRALQPQPEQTMVEPRVWPRLRTATPVQQQQSAKTISYSVGNTDWR